MKLDVWMVQAVGQAGAAGAAAGAAAEKQIKKAAANTPKVSLLVACYESVCWRTFVQVNRANTGGINFLTCLSATLACSL